MTYSVTNPPVCLIPSIGGAPALWTYKSEDDDGTVNGSDYFTNGKELGMQVGDFLLSYETDNNIGSIHAVTGIDADGNATVSFAVVA